MATRPKAKVIERDLGMKRAQRSIKALDGWAVTIGVHGEDGGQREGEIDNIGLAAVHEFGASFMHPGGTPYTVGSVGGSSRSGGMVGSGAVVFLPKGSPNAIGVTRPHRINIPERSFLRAAFDRNQRKYSRVLEAQTGRAIDGAISVKQALGIVGEVALSDVINRINRGIPPKLRPATVARKGSTKPLIDTGQLKGSIKAKVEKG